MSKNQKLNSNEKLNRFNFGIVDLCGDSLKDSSVGISRDQVEDTPYAIKLLPYENYLYLKYMYASEMTMLKDAKSSIRLKLIHAIEFFKNCRCYINFKILQKNVKQIDELEDYIAFNSTLDETIKRNLEKDGYPYVSIERLIVEKEISENIINLYKSLLNKLKDYLKQVNYKSLKKTYPLINLDTYLKLLGIKDKKVKEIAELCLLTSYKDFKYTFVGFNPTYFAVKQYLNYDISEEFALKYKGILFVEGNKVTNGDQYPLTLSRNVFIGLMTFYNNPKDILKIFVTPSDNFDLTTKDFYYIPQIKYLKSLIESNLKENNKGINILLYGIPGCGKTALAKALLNEINCEGYEVNSMQLKQSTQYDSYELGNNARIGNYMVAQAVLKNNKKAILLYDEAEDMFRRDETTKQAKGSMNTVLESNPIITIWTTNDLYCMEQSYLRRFTYTLNIDKQPEDIYLKLVDKLANKYKVNLTTKMKDTYKLYKPNLGIVEKTLKNYSITNSQNEEDIITDIKDSLRGENKGEALPILEENNKSFNIDLLNTSENLKEITEDIKRTGRLDFSMLLYGVPGSSKSSYGRYLANELGLKAICKSYTELSSMWVGKTEKNIQELFEEARRDNAMIILDEVDVLLQDRTKSMRSWEISQTEALLIEMEKHPLPFIMTSNLYNNLDPAVMRRILYKIKHEYLNEEQIKNAFNYFFKQKINENLHLSKLTPGDFIVVKKQAEFRGKLDDKNWLIEKLTNEMNQKKALDTTTKIEL